MSYGKFLASALLAWVWAAPGLAQKKGESELRGETRLEVSDKRKARKKKAEEEKKKVEERTGPARFVAPAEEVERSAMADQKRDEAIDKLKNIIRNPAVQGEQKGELLFQLAELWWEKSKSVYFKEMRKYDDDYQKWLQDTNRGIKRPEPKLNTRESELYRSEVMRLYEAILRDYPVYGRKDEVLFNYAYNLYDINKKDRAMEKYWELIKQFPTSRYVPDAYVQMGEHFFATNQLAKAKKSYEEAAKSKNPKIYPFALYKLAWCDYNAGEYENAIRKFKDVVAYTEGQRVTTDLKREALRDMVKSFEKVDAVEEAWRYFENKTGPKDARHLTKKLAGQFTEAGKHDYAIKTYRYLVNSDPNDPEAPDYQNAVVHAYEGLHQRDRVKKEMLRMVELYRPTSPWAKVNASNQGAIRNACEITETAMRTMVTDYHAEAQKTKSVDTYRLARDIYKEYLENFAKVDVIKDCAYDDEIVALSYNLRFYYADILYLLQEWDLGARQFEMVTDSNPKGPHSRNAMYNALLCVQKLAQGKTGGDLRGDQRLDEKKKKEGIERVTLVRHGKDAKAEPVPKWEQELVRSIDKYVGLYPGDEDEIEVRYKASKIFYDHNHDVEAAKRFGEIILKWPTDKRSRLAADLSLDILNAREEWFELNRLSREFNANKKLSGADKEFAARIGDLVEASQYKYIDEHVYKRDKKTQEAAEGFRAFVKEFAKSKYSPQALLYAMVIFGEAHQLDLSIDVGEQILREYPDARDVQKNELVPRTTLYLGSFYERISDFRRAADYYEKYVVHFIGKIAPDEKDEKGKKGRKKAEVRVAKRTERKPGEKKDADDPMAKVADALYNAALWNEGLAEFNKAILMYTRYIKEFPEKKEVPDLFFNIGLIYEKQKKWTDAAKLFAGYGEQYGRVLPPDKVYYGKYKQFRAFREMKDDKQAHKLQEELLKLGAKLTKDEREKDHVLNAYGHLRYLALEPEWHRYKQLKFLKFGKQLKKDLDVKAKEQQALEKSYTEVLALGSADWGIAALTRIGQSYKDFADNINSMPDPKGFDEDQVAMFRSELEARYVFPMEEKAVEAFEKAVAKSSELSIYNEATLQAQEMINKVKPGSFGEVRQIPYQGSELFATASPIKTVAAAAAPAAAPGATSPPGPTSGSQGGAPAAPAEPAATGAGAGSI